MDGSELSNVGSAQILFCSMNNTSAHLDCVSESAGTWGWPFSMVVHIPPGVEWSAAAAKLLGRWTGSARPIDVQLAREHHPIRVWLSDGVNSMRLDVVDLRIQAPA